MKLFTLLLLLSMSLIANDKPNFIVIIADDLGWNDLGCYGNEGIRTPNLDKLAVEGLKFNNAFLTISSCSPSRCSIMTGMFPHNTGAPNLHDPLPADKVTIGGYLKKAGYYTASVGKWHLGDNILNQYDLVTDSKPAGSELWIDALQKRPKDKPFFMWFASHDAHRPWQATKGKHAISKPHKLDEVTVPPYFPDTPEVREDLAQYYDEIHRLDDYTGQVLEELKKQGISDNTMVVFISDNGRAFPMAKTRVIDSGIKTPFLVHWPKALQKEKDRNQLVSTIDILPTFLELAGLDIPAEIQGKSFTSMLGNPQAKTQNYVFAEHNWHDYKARERMVRSLDYIYIENSYPELNANPPADGVRSPTFQTMLKLYSEGKLTKKQSDCFVVPRPATELFNAVNDPFSFENLANDERYSAKAREMKAVLDKWCQDTGDTLRTNAKEDGFHRTTGKRLKKK